MATPIPKKVAEAAAMIDHTILHPSATRQEVVRVAREGLEHGCASVCVQPIWVPEVTEILKGSAVKVCSVVGFPHGANRPQTIAFEADRAVREGAREIDMVMPIGRAKMEDWDVVGATVSTVKAAVGKVILKVILEISELDSAEIAKASEVCVDAGADFIKTSTGFGKYGATLEGVRMMAGVAEGRAGVKAAGGIRNWETMKEMLEAGATRIGASSTLQIIEEARAELGG